ncbi:MAG: glycosyltransferase family 2 protein [Saprospiraceae bacterium]
MIVLQILLLLVALYLGFGVLYQLGYAIAGLLPTPKPIARDEKLRSFAVFIAAYKEDGVIVETARRALRQRYPQELFEIVVLADKMRDSTIAKLRKLPIRVVEMDFTDSTKSKSLREGIAAVDHLNYDGAIVLDADNQMAPDFLLEANRYMSAGFRAVQGQRTAPPLKGLNETARWDAISEAINNHILCAGHHAIGLSARLAGSGMIFDFNLFKKVMQDVHAIGGFDKELELRLTQMGESIAYAEDAIVYDEKVGNPEVFARQRGRWLAAQYTYARRFVGKGIAALVLRGQVDFFNKAIQMALPPRLLLPVSLLVLATACLPFNLNYSAVFAGLFMLNVSSFALAVPPSMWESASWMLISRLPQLVWQACRAVVMIPASAKTFYHTPHAEVIVAENEEVHV